MAVVLSSYTLVFGCTRKKKTGKINFQAFQRRRLVRPRLASGNGVHVSATFSRPERGRTQESLTEVRLVLVFSQCFKT